MKKRLTIALLASASLAYCPGSDQPNNNNNETSPSTAVPSTSSSTVSCPVDRPYHFGFNLLATAGAVYSGWQNGWNRDTKAAATATTASWLAYLGDTWRSSREAAAKTTNKK